MLCRIARCLVLFTIIGTPPFHSDSPSESCCQYSNVNTNRFMVVRPVTRARDAERGSACSTKSVLPGHRCAVRARPGAQTLERGFDLAPCDDAHALDGRDGDVHAGRRLLHAPGCRRMSAQKDDGLDLACRAEHGATVSAVQYARRILPGKEQSVELGQEGDSWNVGQGLLEDVDVLCQG